MKVDNLLAQYLYKYKRLSLHGIGIFTLDDNAVFPDESAKVKTQIEGVSFVSNPSAQLDDSLIEYIKSETGKMKALAEADLDSYVALAHQFLNIGKPFYFEGIGTLQKNTDGTFSFNAGTAVPLKTDEGTERHGEQKKKSAYSAEDNSRGRISINPAKLLLVAGILGTIVMIVWGGYYLYNKNTAEDQPVSNENNVRIIPDSQVVQKKLPDTTLRANNMPTQKDSATEPAPKQILAASTTVPAKTSEGSFKFIFETTDKKTRALQRYNQIKGLSVLKSYHKIQMETNDSVNFNIFMIVPCAAADTSRYKDSLNAWYYGTNKMKVKIAY